jgi:hypothetical protein
MFFFQEKEICLCDGQICDISPKNQRGQSCRGQRARQREREERRKNLHNKSLVSANNGEENEESRYVN